MGNLEGALSTASMHCSTHTLSLSLWSAQPGQRFCLGVVYGLDCLKMPVLELRCLAAEIVLETLLDFVRGVVCVL